MATRKRYLPLLAAVLFAAFAGVAHAQLSVIQQPGTVIGSFTATGFVPDNGTDVVLLTVPGDRYARVTDVLFNNHGSGPCEFYIDMNGYTNLWQAVIGGTSSQHIALNNGFGIPPGGTLGAFLQSDGANGVTCTHAYANYDRRVVVRGYYFTVP